MSITKTSELPETRDIVCPYCNGNLTVSKNCMSIPCSYCNKHINIKTILSPSEEKKKSYSEATRDIVCPYCKGNLTVSTNCMSISCSHCNKHINIKTILSPSEEKKKSSVEKRSLHCFKCDMEIFVDERDYAVICKHCSRHNDLRDYTIKSSRLGRNLETHGTLYLKKKGKIETSNIQVRDAIIQGKIKGNLKAIGSIKVMKRGEVYGKITCRKLIVNNGGIFDGSVEMLDVEPNHS